MSKFGDFFKKMGITMKKDAIISLLNQSGKEIYFLQSGLTGTGENLGKFVRKEKFFGEYAGWELVQGEDNFLDFLETLIERCVITSERDIERNEELILVIVSRMEISEDKAKKYFNMLKDIVISSKEGKGE